MILNQHVHVVADSICNEQFRYIDMTGSWWWLYLGPRGELFCAKKSEAEFTRHSTLIYKTHTKSIKTVIYAI
jgi:hypothetical protein